jgi:RNA polymerase sigma factor (sigma-70 family)
VTVDPLVAAIRAGHSDGWRNAYAAHAADMHGAAFKVVRNKSDRDDAVQEAISSVMKSGLPHDVRDLRALLCQVSRNKAWDIIRRNRRLVLVGEGGDVAAEAAMTWSDQNPEGLALDRIDVDRALACRSSMNDKQWYALEQRLMLNRPAKDVAVELDVQPQRVSQLIIEAIAVIRQKQSFVVNGTDDLLSQQTAVSGTEGDQ